MQRKFFGTILLVIAVGLLVISSPAKGHRSDVLTGPDAIEHVFELLGGLALGGWGSYLLSRRFCPECGARLRLDAEQKHYDLNFLPQVDRSVETTQRWRCTRCGKSFTDVVIKRRRPSDL